MRTPEKIKVYIVDDHQIVIDGLCSLLNNEPEFEIAGTSHISSEVMAALERKQVDIVITDVQMPDVSGVELTRLLQKKFPKVYILALSMFGDIASVRQMLDSGISGYILKNTGKEELIKALRTIARGENYFSPDVTREMMRAVKDKSSHSTHLTNREIEIVRLIAKDIPNKQIAGILFISERTVETHRKNILRKTNTQTAVGLMKFAYENKII
jgi:two-component system nitrate/nitrite response regulator NarL